MAGLCALRNKVRVFPCKTGVKQSQALCSDGESVLACFCAIRCGTGIPAGCRGCPGGRYQREDRGEPREDGKVELYRLLDTQRPAAVFSYDEDVTNVIAACLTNTYTLPDIYTTCYDKNNTTVNPGFFRRDPVMPETRKRYPRELPK